MTSDFTDETVMAFVDGELDEITAGRLARAAAADAGLRGKIDAQHRLRDTLSARYDPILDEPVDARFQAMLGDNVVPLEPRRHPAPRFGWREAAAIAATFAVGFLTAQTIRPSAGMDVGPPLAAGRLKAALETQLASAQAADAPVRIGVTFASSDGRTCRTFEAQAMAGIACREARGWNLVAAAASQAAPAGEYRQAGSGSAWVMEQAQEMMAGEALDADAERLARERGWRRNDKAR